MTNLYYNNMIILITDRHFGFGVVYVPFLGQQAREKRCSHSSPALLNTRAMLLGTRCDVISVSWT